MISVLSALIGGDLRLRDAKALSSDAALPLSIGEVVDATVVGKEGSKLLIDVKGMTLAASSNLPLAEGQTVSLRISQLQPSILLVALNGTGEALEGGGMQLEHLIRFKQDPGMLTGIFTASKDVLSPAKIASYRQLLPGTDVSAISERLDSLLFSKESLDGLADKLGLLHEYNIASGKGAADNLKAMLIALQDDIAKAVSAKPDAAKELSELSAFAAASIDKIEAYQTINVLSLEKDGPFFLPLPFLFQNGIRTGEFYGTAKDTAEGKELRAVVFMDLEKLGKVMAEARMVGGGLRCLFRCEVPETRDFLSERISLLKDGLDALGYQTGDIRCCHERNMEAARRELQEELPPYQDGLLNIRA